jgi:hypothetical protein
MMVTRGPFMGINYITVDMILSIMISPSLITSTTFLTSPQTVSQSTPKLYQWIRNGANKYKAILFHLLYFYYFIFIPLPASFHHAPGSAAVTCNLSISK